MKINCVKTFFFYSFPLFKYSIIFINRNSFAFVFSHNKISMIQKIDKLRLIYNGVSMLVCVDMNVCVCVSAFQIAAFLLPLSLSLRLLFLLLCEVNVTHFIFYQQSNNHISFDILCSCLFGAYFVYFKHLNLIIETIFFGRQYFIGKWRICLILVFICCYCSFIKQRVILQTATAEKKQKMK